MINFLQSRGLSSSLQRFGLSAENTLVTTLCADNDRQFGFTPSRHFPRETSRAHFSHVCPEKVTTPKLVHVSKSVAVLVGIEPDETSSELFVNGVSGNSFFAGLDCGYATVYGCHAYGQWLGQLGDGRAVAVGEVKSPVDDGRYELQLKGAGQTPYSRGFDGRAVLRSSIRELLASEAMHHLGVKTTRALSVIATADTVNRKWYAATSATSTDMTERHHPQSAPATIQETCAVLCRVSSSFFRFGHVEYFAKKKDSKASLVQMVDYVVEREFDHLLAKPTEASVNKPEVYIAMFRECVSRSMKLVTEWTRVGYCHGNLNSDNIHIAGLTLDYGPFGWMEMYSPSFQPFAADRKTGKFCFQHQAGAMHVSLETLGECMGEAVRGACEEQPDVYSRVDVINFIDQIDQIVKHDVLKEYANNYEQMILDKLGLGGDFSPAVYDLWRELEHLMTASSVDYTILFRKLADVVAASASGVSAIDILRPAFYDESLLEKPVNHSGVDDSILLTSWRNWLENYSNLREQDRMTTPGDEGNDDPNTPAARATRMNKSNPKYILRNWMATMAYESADKGDFSLVQEIAELLEQPYAEGTEEAHRKWFAKTPTWAAGKPGVAFMS